MANVRGFCPSAATVRALLKAGADPSVMDHAGLTALDYTRWKLARLQARPRTPQPKSPSLDENNQLQLAGFEQREPDDMRRRLGAENAREFIHLYWQARLRAAKRKFNDVDEVISIVEILERVTRRS